MRLFRGLSFGRLADIHLLDTRQFRSDQPAGDGFGSTSPASVAIEPVIGETLFDAKGILDPAATLLGGRQARWLETRLRRSQAVWNVLAQQVMVMPWNLVRTSRVVVAATLQAQSVPPEQQAQILAAFDAVDNIFNVDAWDGYPAARRRLLEMLQRSGARNPVILSGDIHSAWGANLLADFEDAGSDVLAAEFVCTSISSTFLDLDPRPTDFAVRQGLVATPHIEYFNGLFRGYCLCDVDTARWQTRYRAVGDLAGLADTANPLALVPFPDSPVDTDAVLEIEAGFNSAGSGRRLQTSFARFPV
jgi:alkaline phosphatase D